MCDMGCLKLTEVHHVSEQVAVDDGERFGVPPIRTTFRYLEKVKQEIQARNGGVSISWDELEQNPDVQAGLRKELDKQSEQEQE